MIEFNKDTDTTEQGKWIMSYVSLHWVPVCVLSWRFFYQLVYVWNATLSQRFLWWNYFIVFCSLISGCDVSWAANDCSCWGKWKAGIQIEPEWSGKRWSWDTVKTIARIGYAVQCGTELLIWNVGLLNLSFHYSSSSPKDIRSLQVGSQWALSVVLTVKRQFIFHFKTRKCYNLTGCVCIGNFAVPPHGRSWFRVNPMYGISFSKHIWLLMKTRWVMLWSNPYEGEFWTLSSTSYRWDRSWRSCISCQSFLLFLIIVVTQRNSPGPLAVVITSTANTRMNAWSSLSKVRRHLYLLYLMKVISDERASTVNDVDCDTSSNLWM